MRLSFGKRFPINHLREKRLPDLGDLARVWRRFFGKTAPSTWPPIGHLLRPPP
jgi:hypothetical protein